MNEIYNYFYVLNNLDKNLIEIINKSSILVLNDNINVDLLYYILFYLYFNNLINFNKYYLYFNKHIIKHIPKHRIIQLLTYKKNIDNEIILIDELYTLKKNDNLYIFNMYIKYYKYIFDNFNIINNPIEINIIDKNKYEIYEGTHRFIICYIKKIEPCIIVKESNYKIYNDIISKLNKDYDLLYKKNNKNFCIYNKIPHFLFKNYKQIRFDRSNIIINFLKNKLNLKTGLEIGPQNGLMSLQLSKNNYKMTAIEYDNEYYNLTKNISELCDINIKCINNNIYNEKIEELQYDFIVSLSVFYHLKRNNINEFELFFKDIIKKTKYIFFDDEIKTNILKIDYIKTLYDSNNYNITLLYTDPSDKRSIYVLYRSNI